MQQIGHDLDARAVLLRHLQQAQHLPVHLAGQGDEDGVHRGELHQPAVEVVEVAQAGNATEADVVFAAAVVQIADDREAQVWPGQQGANEAAPGLAHADDQRPRRADAAPVESVEQQAADEPRDGDEQNDEQ